MYAKIISGIQMFVSAVFLILAFGGRKPIQTGFLESLVVLGACLVLTRLCFARRLYVVAESKVIVNLVYALLLPGSGR